jgi:xanthine/uracil permease
MPESRTLPELVSQLTTDLATLVRKESELVRTELTEKLHTAGKAVGEIAAGGILLLAALLVLLQALVIALSKVMDPLWASLLVGVAVAAIGVFLVRTGMKLMKPEHLKPDRTTRQLQKDAELVKGR